MRLGRGSMSIKIVSRFVVAVAIGGATLCAQSPPQIYTIQNSATYAISGVNNAGIARGSIFIIFGSGLGGEALEQAKSFPLPPTLGGTSIRVTVGSTNVDVPVVYTLSQQVAALLPSTTPVGKGTLTLTYKGAGSLPRPINVVESSLGSIR